jgi:protein Tex
MLTDIAFVANEFGFQESQVAAVADLLAQDATIPFIARYRKEATGSLDEVAITAIRDRLTQLAQLNERKEAILRSLERNGHLTDELKNKVSEAQSLAALEDVYLPYRPKRRTRAAVAREKGLEPLAVRLLDQQGLDPDEIAAEYVNSEKGVDSPEDALSGARDILAEMINENAAAREKIRDLFGRRAIMRSRIESGKESAGAKFKDYFEWDEPAAAAPSHRVLAMRRGEKEEILHLSIAPPEEDAIAILESMFVKTTGPDAAQVRSAVQDAYHRLMARSMETEIRLALKQRADTEAIRIFTENLRHLLLAPPLGPKTVMGLDPGFRTGCKLVCLDPQGKLMHHDTIYPHTSDLKRREAQDQVKTCYERFEIQAIAVGNGTAGRETQAFLKQISSEHPIPVLMVDESGASVYSASNLAREEFPNLDVSVRGAVSIARRLIDPLAELVKIDPKSIGVGQYQHDVDQPALKQALDETVISCVNHVGVDVNQASAQLLTYISGLGPQLAKNIVAFRDENGPFRSRTQLLNVPRMGPKAFEQAAGFLRIQGGDNPLDTSAVHPESYPLVEAMAADLGCTIADLLESAALRARIEIQRYVSDQIGLPTLTDILAELDKPGRDPRDRFETVAYADDVQSISDLRQGMVLPGVVTNVTAFGAFVDVGVHQDGLVHISELADRFVKDPLEVVKVHQSVQVTVIGVDLDRNRIALSMKKNPGQSRAPDAHGRSRAAKPKPAKTSKSPFHNPFVDQLSSLTGRDAERKK